MTAQDKIDGLKIAYRSDLEKFIIELKQIPVGNLKSPLEVGIVQGKIDCAEQFIAHHSVLCDNIKLMNPPQHPTDEQIAAAKAEMAEPEIEIIPPAAA